MIKLISKDERREFTSTHDKDEPKSVFVIRPLTQRERIAVEKHLSRNDYSKNKEVGFSMTERDALYIRLGVIDWKHVTNGDGKEVPYAEATENFSIPGLPPRKALREDIIDSLPGDIIAELGDAISDWNKVSGDDEKN